MHNGNKSKISGSTHIIRDVYLGALFPVCEKDRRNHLWLLRRDRKALSNYCHPIVDRFHQTQTKPTLVGRIGVLHRLCPLWHIDLISSPEGHEDNLGSVVP